MDLYLKIIYVIVFFTMIVVSVFILMASNFERFFKQGKINEIRFAYVIIALITSFLTAEAVTSVIRTFYEILQ